MTILSGNDKNIWSQLHSPPLELAEPMPRNSIQLVGVSRTWDIFNAFRDSKVQPKMNTRGINDLLRP